MADDTAPWDSPDVSPLVDPNAAPPMADPTPATPAATNTDDSIWAWLGFHKASQATLDAITDPNATPESIAAAEAKDPSLPDAVTSPVTWAAPKVAKAIKAAAQAAGVPDPATWWDQNKIYFIIAGVGIGGLLALFVIGYSARGIASVAHEVRS